MHLYEKQMFIVDEHREPHYGLALGTGSNSKIPALNWVDERWSKVRHCSSFHFGPEHFGLVIGPADGFALEDYRRLLDTIPKLSYPADHINMVAPNGSLIVLATRSVTSSGLAVAYSTWFEGSMQIAMSRHCGPVLWFGTWKMHEPPTDLITRIDHYARRRKASSWGPGRIYLVNDQEFEECDCQIEPQVWHAEMQGLDRY